VRNDSIVVRKNTGKIRFFCILKGSGYRKMRRVGSLSADRIGYRTVVIDVCLFFMGPSSFLQRISVSVL
jgi:hypothetical protein